MYMYYFSKNTYMYMYMSFSLLPSKWSNLFCISNSFAIKLAIPSPSPLEVGISDAKSLALTFCDREDYMEIIE